VFVVTIVVIAFGTSSWRWDDAFGYRIAHKISSVYEIPQKTEQCRRMGLGNLSDSVAIGWFNQMLTPD
jgi:Ni,Fe-hydrogenase maturation factor